MPATPWRDWEGDLPGPHVTLVRDGTRVGETSLLAEALRTDGIANNMGHAYALVEKNTRFSHGWYGYLPDDRTPVMCTELGDTEDGETVERILPCVLALVEVA